MKKEKIKLNQEKLKEIFERIIKQLYNHHKTLIYDEMGEKEDYQHVSEWGIVAWFFHYLVLELDNKTLSIDGEDYDDFNIDIEYNREEYLVKKLAEKGIRPDLIIHKRREETNILFLEFKTWWSTERIEEDIIKVTEAVKSKNYKFGATIILDTDDEKTIESIRIYTKENYPELKN